MAARPWNILWISLEDTSPRFGCTGDRIAKTPHLDGLAAAGCRWPNAFSVAGVCAPSRAAVITGMYPNSIGAMHMRTTHPGPPGSSLPTPYYCVPPAYVRCFPEYLRAAGYYCTNAYKTDYQFEPPMTAWDECLTPRAHWRSRPAAAQPFFAVFNFNGTHESGMWQEKGGVPKTDPASLTLPPIIPDTHETRLALARHYDNLAAADLFVGERLAELEADGLADRTVVMIWSDHGEGLPRHKRWPYDGGIRVPLIVRWPGQIAPGSVRDDLVSMIDLGPTVLGIAGVPAPAHLQGQAFIGPTAAPARRYIYASRDRYDASYDMMRAVRDERFKYIRNYYPDKPYLLWIPYRNKHAAIEALWDGQRAGTLTPAQQQFMAQSRPPEELYDTHADPHEFTNLAADPAHAETLARLRAACDAWMADIRDLGHTPESQMVQQWWPGGVQPTSDQPYFIPYHAGECGREPTLGGTFHGPVDIDLYCSTQGASMTYTFSEEAEPRDWQLYTGAIRLPAGASTLRAKSVRIGYKDSHEVAARFVVTED